MSFTEPANQAFLLDRAEPVGNSPGSDNRGRAHVLVSNKATEPIPVFVTSGSTAMPHFASTPGPVPTTPGTEQVLISEVVTATTARNYSRLVLTCRQPSWFKVVVISGVTETVIGSGRTGPAALNAALAWDPGYPVNPGDTVEVRFTERSGSPVAEVEAYLMATDI